ncbi:hypothetical protein AB0J74_12510 [Asanoa sp. NPDC049573]|uniref:hypothetical protein n=1 Tax=Asanoa sp. NPDC049573 TaxID=3155396 RepID=UPI00342B1EAB
MPPSRRVRLIRTVLLAPAVAGLAACAAQIAVAPLPIESAAATAPTAPATQRALPSATTTVPPQPRPPRIHRNPPAPSATGPTRESNCLGPVVYELTIAETEFETLRPLCLRAGAILRLRGIGPGLVTVDPESLVARSYEAGVVDIALLRPGTVEVTIPHDERTDTVTVVVVS